MKPILLLQHPRSSSLIPRPWVRFGRDGDILRVTFRIPGDNSMIAFPPSLRRGKVQAPELRADRLWEHTCFEVFVRPSDIPEYVEFNFSPSGEWAAYRFDDYREGVRNADVRAPGTIMTLLKNRFELSAMIEIAGWGHSDWNANFSAVIEEKNGGKSYWALSHPPGETPNFHHPDCFVAHLPPVVTP